MPFGLRAILSAAGLVVALTVVLSSQAAPRPSPDAASLPNRPVVVYYDCWNATPSGAATLANLPQQLNVVDLAFARPDLPYRGDLDIAQVGFECPFSGHELHDAIAALKRRWPATRVLVSVGGEAYRNWDRYDPDAVARLVHDLGADGVDLDYEPTWPGCHLNDDRHVSCRTDRTWKELVKRTRAVLPPPYLLTAPVWSVGAFGEGEYEATKPSSRYTGFMLSILRSSYAAQFDLLSIDAYDVGPKFDPLLAFKAYRAVWPGVLALGVEVSRKGGPGPFPSAAAAEALAREVSKDKNGAMMLYALLAKPSGTSDGGAGPDGRVLANALCRGLVGRNCQVPP